MENLPSALRPVPNPDSIPGAAPKDIADCMTERELSWEGDDGTGADNYAPQNPYIVQTFYQAELNDLIRDLESRQNVWDDTWNPGIYWHLACLYLGTETVKKDLHAIFNDWFPCTLLRY